MAIIRGSQNGHSNLLGTRKPDRFLAYGDANTVTGGGGNDTVIANTGNGNLILLSSGPRHSATIVLGGNNDTVACADSTVLIRGYAPGAEMSLGTGKQTVRVYGGDIQITVGGGSDKVPDGGLVGSYTVLGGHSTLVFDNYYVPDYNETIAISGAGNSINNAFDQVPFPANGTMNIHGGSGSGTFNMGGASGTLVTGGAANSIIGGYGNDTIWAGSGSDSVYLTGGPRETGGTAAVHLSGTANVVTGQEQFATITGGAGQDTIQLTGEVLQQGGYSIKESGLDNNISVSTGSATIFAGAGADTVTLTSALGTVTFTGAGDVLNLGGPFSYAGPPGVFAEAAGATGLHVFEGGSASGQPPATGNLTLDHFDSTGIVDFVGGRGGFASVQDVMQDLVNEGGGSWQLVFADQSGTITFLHTPTLTASNFAIG